MSAASGMLGQQASLAVCAPAYRDADVQRREEVRYVVTAMLLVVAIIHLLPLSGVLAANDLPPCTAFRSRTRVWKFSCDIRAVLFGLLGLFLLYAAFQPAIQLLAFVAAFASVLSFVWLAWSVGNYNEQVGRVFAADIVALFCLVVGLGAYVLTVRQDGALVFGVRQNAGQLIDSPGGGPVLPDSAAADTETGRHW